MRASSAGRYLATIVFFACGAVTAGDAGPANPPEPCRMLPTNTAIPMAIVAEKTGTGGWCPVKVISLSAEQCSASLPPTVPAGTHRACREPRDLIRWVVLDRVSLDVVNADFEVAFQENDPLDQEGGNGAKCSKSTAGLLACRIRSNARTARDYPYRITMSGGPACARDARLYLNPMN